MLGNYGIIIVVPRPRILCAKSHLLVQRSRVSRQVADNYNIASIRS